MADIFVSYASGDRERVRPIVDALRARDWTIWWDRQIDPGASYDTTIEDEIAAASCVIAVWTETSIGSEWVQTEAMDGLNRGVLIPILLDEVEMPLAFRRTQAANLAGWPENSYSGAEFDRLLGGIGRLVGSASPAPVPDDQLAPAT